MPRTRVRRVGQESVSLQALVLWCSSCNGLMGEMVRCAWETNYFRYYKRLEPIAKLATSYLRKRLARGEVMPFMAKLPRVLVGMEACGGAHDWARQLREQGHEVRLMAPQYVKPYVKTNNNDLRDAEAIAAAVTRPSMRFVPIK